MTSADSENRAVMLVNGSPQIWPQLCDLAAVATAMGVRLIGIYPNADEAYGAADILSRQQTNDRG